MRVEPATKRKKRNEAPFYIRVEKTMRIVAIILAFMSTFIFFFKILFF